MESTMDIKEGKYATMKDGRTIYITKVLESCTEFIGNEISSKGSPKVTANGNGTYLFDIHMENELPEYLQYDFGLTDK